MLYWNLDRRLTVAMVTNNSLAPALHQVLQRALVRAADRNSPLALEPELKQQAAVPGRYRSGRGESIELRVDGQRWVVVRRGLSYPAIAVGGGIRYIPGLDLYLSGDGGRCVRIIGLYEVWRAC